MRQKAREGICCQGRFDFDAPQRGWHAYDDPNERDGRGGVKPETGLQGGERFRPRSFKRGEEGIATLAAR